MDKLFLRIPEVVEAIGLGRSSIYERLATGELKSSKVGGTRLVHVDDLNDFAARVRGGSPERLQDLLALVDDHGRLDVGRIPKGTTLADLEAVKQALRNGQPRPKQAS